MTRNMRFGIVRDRVTGETFDIAVPLDSLEMARQKLAQSPNLELLLDGESDESQLPATVLSASVQVAANAHARP